MHPFRPDVYSVEQVEDHRYIAVARLLSDRVASLSEEAMGRSFLYLRPREVNKSEELIKIPRALKPQCYMYGRINPTTQSPGNLEENLNLTLSSIGRPFIPPNILLDSGSSVLRMIALGIHSNIRNIVLVGVDLNSSAYFFEEQNLREQFDIPIDYNPWLARTSKHPTDLRHGQGFSFTEMVRAIDRLGQRNGMWKIWTGSTNSALAKTLSTYHW